MRIEIAKSAGFCMGVRRAVELVLDAANKYPAPIYTFGPLIHNPQVLSVLEEKGISVIKEIPDKGVGTVLIRAHGIPPETKEHLKKAGFSVIDATCPHVIKVQTIIRKYTRQGYQSIIIGDKDHPEVIGLLGYAGDNGIVINHQEELEALPIFEKAIIVAQTTQNSTFFTSVTDWAQKKAPHYELFNTICDATERRQSEIRELAAESDAMIVVGGRNSGNTNRLAEIVRKMGKPVFHVETENELDPRVLADVQTIGITAGASTPSWIIKKVFRSLEHQLSKHQQGWRSTLFILQRNLLLTNIYLSMGAGALCYACLKLQGMGTNVPVILIAMLYVLSMHIFNNLTGRRSIQYNDPDRALYYKAHRTFLTLIALIAGIVGLMTSFTLGWLPFTILLAMTLTGVSYNLRIIPKGIGGGRYQRIRDIPGSKTVLIAFAWGIICSIVPPIALKGALGFSTVLVFAWSVCMVFIRTAFFDILDMQGDRIVGRETIPILLGERQTIKLLKTLLLISITVLVIPSILRLMSGIGIGLTLSSVFLYAVISRHGKDSMLPSIGLEFLVETHFILAGVITFLMSMIL